LFEAINVRVTQRSEQARVIHASLFAVNALDACGRKGTVEAIRIEQFCKNIYNV
jgi:hypothetical protein